jgi:hypothetical protein
MSDALTKTTAPEDLYFSICHLISSAIPNSVSVCFNCLAMKSGYASGIRFKGEVIEQVRERQTKVQNGRLQPEYTRWEINSFNLDSRHFPPPVVQGLPLPLLVSTWPLLTWRQDWATCRASQNKGKILKWV